ncbi:hypothetical protein NQ315_014864 [Exocentrus adspersus]|uniref:Uncharacterized protein n=1 Tax=Exocentrus adspersus TaxID=1586481 RepID=A0AAV8VKG0_9CUCU|nr:hypothetical protein NQ315_014864 [Exocentrus adspersus]
MSRSSLYKFMKQINFRYLKRNRKSVMIERDDIVRWRVDYLTSIKKFRSEGRPIYYLDETWLNEGHTKEKVWVDNNIKSKCEAFNEGLSTGLKNPSGKGKRLIILHAGSEEGFVEDSLLVFEGKKSGDYHEEMNANVFEKWFVVFLRKLPDNAVIHPYSITARKNKTFKLKDVKELLIEALNNVAKVNWKKCVEHVIKEEEKMSTLDEIIDDLIEPLIISVNNMESDADTTDTDSSTN